MDPARWRIFPSLHLGALNGLGGGPATLLGTGSHSIRGPQHLHWPIPEPSQSACTLTIPPHEYVFAITHQDWGAEELIAFKRV